MDIFNVMLTDKLWDFSGSVAFGITFILILLGVVSVLDDDRSKRRLLVVVIGLIIVTFLFGRQIINVSGVTQTVLAVVGLLIVNSLIFELVPFFDRIIGRLSHLARKFTLITGIFTISVVTLLILPLSYLYLYGLSYPPCALTITNLDNTEVTLPAFEGNQVAYLNWRNSERYNHSEDFCAEVFQGTKGQVSKSLLPEIYNTGNSLTSYYRVETPITDGEEFMVIDVVDVKCSAGSCRDFEEGVYYVLQNSLKEFWVASTDTVDLLK